MVKSIRKIGLCIGGGGANGAYAVGVIEKLLDSEFQPHVLSGTSVGGLIAASLSADRLSMAKTLLIDSKKRSKILPFMPPAAQGKGFLLFAKILLVVVFYLFASLPIIITNGWGYLASIFYTLVPGRWIWKVLFALAVVTAVTILLIPALVPFFTDLGNTLLNLSLASLILPAILITIFSFRYFKMEECPKPASHNDFRAYMQIIIGFAITMAMLALSFEFSNFILTGSNSFSATYAILENWGFLGEIISFLILAIVSCVVLAVIIFVLYFCYAIISLVDFSAISIFSNSPLQSSVRNVLQTATLQLPVYVASAVFRTLYDPDNIVWRHTPPTMDSPEEWERNFIERHIPHYHYLNGFADKKDAEKRLIASASIPGRILPKVKINGELHVDGMMADNVPIKPLLFDEECDLIIAISLSEEESEADDLIRNASQFDRLVRLSELEEPKDTIRMHSPYGLVKRRVPVNRINNPPRIVPLQPPKKTPLFVAQPNLPLGNPLDFSSEKQNRIYNMGIEDGKKLLDLLRKADAKFSSASKNS